MTLLSTCSWCVVRAYTWLALWLSSPPVAGVWWEHTLDWLYDSLSSPPVAGVWWEHTLDWLYDSLSSPPVAGVWWEHTLDWLYDSLSSPPVAGVWWEHTLDWLYDSLSSPPVAGVWWAHTLDWLYDSLSSPPVAGVWWEHTLDWLYDSLSSLPVAGVWWAHWCHCPVAAVTSSMWMLHTGGGWGETPPPTHTHTHDCKALWVEMGTETWYLIGPGAKLWKTRVSISSDVNGSAIGTGEIKKTHIHLLLVYIYIHIIMQILSHQSRQLFLYTLLFIHFSMMHFCYSQFRSEIALMRMSFSTRNMKALSMIEDRTKH